jgi:hypothetical protein
MFNPYVSDVLFVLLSCLNAIQFHYVGTVLQTLLH